MADYEVKVHDLKDSLFSQALDGLQAPQIVDVGIGSGPNLQYLAKYKVRAPHTMQLPTALHHCSAWLGNSGEMSSRIYDCQKAWEQANWTQEQARPARTVMA